MGYVAYWGLDFGGAIWDSARNLCFFDYSIFGYLVPFFIDKLDRERFSKIILVILLVEPIPSKHEIYSMVCPIIISENLPEERLVFG